MHLDMNFLWVSKMAPVNNLHTIPNYWNKVIEYVEQLMKKDVRSVVISLFLFEEEPVCYLLFCNLF